MKKSGQEAREGLGMSAGAGLVGQPRSRVGRALGGTSEKADLGGPRRQHIATNLTGGVSPVVTLCQALL